MADYTLHTWPESQICMGCIHAQFVEDVSGHLSCAYMCYLGAVTDGITCADKIEL